MKSLFLKKLPTVKRKLNKIRWLSAAGEAREAETG